MSLFFATETTEPSLIDQVEPSRPLTDFLIDWLGLDPESLTAGLLGRLIEPILQFLLIVVLAVLVLWLLRRFGGRLVKRLAGEVASTSPRGAQRIETLASLGSNVAGVVVWTIAIVTILGTVFGLNLGPFLAGAGIVGIAVGFGAQDLVRDMISGLFMMLEDQYGVGDIIDAGDATGTVERMGIRTTRLRDDNGTLWHVPNGAIRRVGNMSQEWSRAVLDVAIAGDSDLENAIAVIRETATAVSEDSAYKHLFLSPPEILGVESVGADILSIRLVVKTRAGEQWTVSRELRMRIKRALDTVGITTG